MRQEGQETVRYVVQETVRSVGPDGQETVRTQETVRYVRQEGQETVRYVERRDRRQVCRKEGLETVRYVRQEGQETVRYVDSQLCKQKTGGSQVCKQ